MNNNKMQSGLRNRVSGHRGIGLSASVYQDQSSQNERAGKTSGAYLMISHKPRSLE